MGGLDSYGQGDSADWLAVTREEVERYRKMKANTKGLRFASEEVGHSRQSLLSAIQVMRSAYEEMAGGDMEVRLSVEAAKARDRGIDLVDAGAVAVRRLFESLRALAFDACTAWTADVEKQRLSHESEHAQRFVGYFEEAEAMLTECRKARPRLQLLHGMSETGLCLMGGLSGASVHEIFADFGESVWQRVGAALMSVRAEREPAATRPKNYPQRDRSKPGDASELQLDDQGILLALLEGPMAGTQIRAWVQENLGLRRGQQHFYHRLADLKKWRWVAKGSREYELTPVGKRVALDTRQARAASQDQPE